MFGPNKVPKSLVDAVSQIMQVDEAAEKVPTPTGMKVYGSSYGNSAKARRDQTKSHVDTIKGPKEKDLKEDGDCVTKPEAKDIAKKEVHHHNKTMHKGQKDTTKNEEVEEDKGVMSFKDRLLERAMTDAESKKKEKIVMSMKDKQSYFKKKYGKRWKEVMYATATKKAMSEEMVEEENLDEDSKADKSVKLAAHDAYVTHTMNVMKGRDIADKKQKMATASNTGKGKPLHNVAKGLKAFLQGKKEPMESVNVEGEVLDEVTAITHQPSADADVATDMLKGRVQGVAKANDFKSFKVKVEGDGITRPQDDQVSKDATPARASVKAGDNDNSVAQPKIQVGEAKQPEQDNVPFVPPYNTTADDVVTDKSGAKHTPMSRAKDLARTAMKRIKTEMLGKISN